MVTEAPHAIRWFAPSPLWGEYSRWMRIPNQDIPEQPSILRFENDQFMDELLALVTHEPWRISEWIVKRETWREPMSTPAPIVKTNTRPGTIKSYNTALLSQFPPRQRTEALTKSLSKTELTDQKKYDINDSVKLYHIAQQRFYLVTASLIRQETGYPDYFVNPTNCEKVSYVIRALLPQDPDAESSIYEEYAYVDTPTGTAWKKLGTFSPETHSLERLTVNEKAIPLFPITYPDYCQKQRKIFAGLIPVGQREEWMAAPEFTGEIEEISYAWSSPQSQSRKKLIKEIFQSDVSERWKILSEQAEYMIAQVGTENPAALLRTARDQIQTGSWYVLLDLYLFLEKNLPQVYRSIARLPLERPLHDNELELLALFRNTSLSPRLAVSIGIENFVLSGYTVRKNTLWQDFIAIWELEDSLEISQWPESSESFTRDIYDRLNDDSFPGTQLELFNALQEISSSGKGFTILSFLHYFETHIPQLRQLALNKVRLADFTLDIRTQINHCRQALNQVTALTISQTNMAVPNLFGSKVTLVHSLYEALQKIGEYKEELLAVDTPFERDLAPAGFSQNPVVDRRWPSFLFPLADMDPTLPSSERFVVPPGESDSPFPIEGLDLILLKLDRFSETVTSLVPDPNPDPDRITQLPRTPFIDQNKIRFVIRCVFERPNCGPMFTPLLSAPSQVFELAPFFDPEAPARPIRIPMPLDISPAGLRKYQKNTMFIISDMLCGKIKKIRKLTLADLVLSVLPWPFHKDLPKVGPTGPCRSPAQTLGLICSLSIPIVTLCALILLMIIVKLFDMFFRWIPYLFICLPLPNFKGKK